MTTKRYLPPLLIGIASFCAWTSGFSASEEGSPEVSERNEAAVFRYLEPVLFSSGKAIRLNYSSDCRTATDATRKPVPFPRIAVRSPDEGATGIAAIRQIFGGDKNVAVTEDASGIVRIQIGKKPPDILQTKLSRLTLNKWQQYNPVQAFQALTGAKQMRAAMASRGFESVWNYSSTGVAPSKEFSHLPPLFTNVTANQVLDKVAKTWAGQIVVLCGVCAERDPSSGQTLFWIGWAGRIAMNPTP